jgi:hypothetical protein
MQFVVDKEIIPLYLDSAKTFMHLSSGALALTISFREKVIGSHPGTGIGRSLLGSWFSFLLCIAASALYQYFGIEYLDHVSPRPGATPALEFFVTNPGYVYGTMLVFFLVGAVLLVISSWGQLTQQRGQSVG